MGCLLSLSIGGSTQPSTLQLHGLWAIANDQTLHPDAHSSADEVRYFSKCLHC